MLAFLVPVGHAAKVSLHSLAVLTSVSFHPVELPGFRHNGLPFLCLECDGGFAQPNLAGRIPDTASHVKMCVAM